MNIPTVVTVGHLLKEVIRFPDKEIGPVLGSPAAYSAVTASRLGVPTGIVTRIGSDMPEVLLQPLYDAGIDTRGIGRQGDSTRTNVLTYDSQGNKSVSYERVAPDIRFDDVPKEYLEAEAVLLCPMDCEIPLGVVQSLGRHIQTMMTDVGGYGGTVSTHHPDPQRPETYGLLRALAGHCLAVKASLEDCRHIFGPEVCPDDAGRALINWGTRFAMITLGADGSIVYGKDDRHRVPAFSAKVVDTTGAGDVYCGAFLAEYTRTRDVRSSALYASAAASVAIERTGGVIASRMPDIREVSNRIAAVRW